ncbi:HCO3 transporter family-domain-containing protein [Pseudoneurospora amorphoporcata]|uniref:HCO3 transporter family-domain-containing protein n=1 Tax=Pseudoneurospora amorphoporcata TaxID=241081 RepID=A0AAN6NPK7_9PEZI|nr:HCO3 transporter family-domain-containing protein [Pseudoneurospora amorphoporcata]
MASTTKPDPGPGPGDSSSFTLPGPIPGTGAGAGGLHTTNTTADDREPGAVPGTKQRNPKWYKIHLFRGMINDLRRRAPYYLSDWTDAWNYRVIPATVYMYFANILPALAFSLDMFTKTDRMYGVNEVLLASVLGAVVFSLLACQPLVIVGVTGPITVFNYTVYDIMEPTGTNYMAFMCWIGLWSLVFHWILAVTNSCNWLRYVTRFPCDVFGFYVAFIYLQKGIQVLERLGDAEPFYLSVVVALCVFAIAYICGELGDSGLFNHTVRVFLKDYGTPLTAVFFTGFVHFGKMENIHLDNLEVSKAFFPTPHEDGWIRGWFIPFWDIPAGHIFLAIPFALLLTILFWFDHNVSSLIAQGTEFPLRKPAGFHWDLFLLGLTTGVSGLLGIPFPNGLIPQAPFHTASLCVTKVVTNDDTDADSSEAKGHPAESYEYKPVSVVEQRVSNLAQGLLTLGTMTGPLLVVLHLIPQGVLAGLFFIMGYQALAGNGITQKLIFLFKDSRLTSPNHPLNNKALRRSRVWLFVIIELIGFGATFAITQTVAAVGFPVFIFALIPVRAVLLPKWLSKEELAALDGPTASPFTMESVGGSYGSADEGEEGRESSRSSSGGDEGSGDGVLGGYGPSSAAGKNKSKNSKVAGEKSAEELAELGQRSRLSVGSGRSSLRRGSTAVDEIQQGQSQGQVHRRAHHQAGR